MPTPLILTSIDQRIGYITLNHPEKHNILCPEMIDALSNAYRDFENNEAVSVIILYANGKHFCAGADLHYMLTMGKDTWENNLLDAKKFANLFYQIYRCQKPTIACAHGNVRGGGIGLIAAHDFAVAHVDATFAFSEVKLGLAPAIISPYVFRRLSAQDAHYSMLTADIFSAQRAIEIKLLDQYSLSPMYEANTLAKTLLENNSTAVQQTKRWLHTFDPITPEKVMDAATLLATMRSSVDALELMRRFVSARD